MKTFLSIIISILTFLPLQAQEKGIFDFEVKAGVSFGGSQPGSFRENKSANLMLDFTGGVGGSIRVSSSWQFCLDFLYIRKGINCPLAPTPLLSTSGYPGFSEENIPEVYGWFDNAYLEIPFTIGYVWGYDICRTRIGAYYARRLATKSSLIIDGNLLVSDPKGSTLHKMYEQHLTNHDYGIKIANEFFFNNFSIGVEFSTGFVSTIHSSWRASESQSYTMAICFYAGYSF